jgi:hypothetical protein
MNMLRRLLGFSEPTAVQISETRMKQLHAVENRVLALYDSVASLGTSKLMGEVEVLPYLNAKMEEEVAGIRRMLAELIEKPLPISVVVPTIGFSTPTLDAYKNTYLPKAREVEQQFVEKKLLIDNRLRIAANPNLASGALLEELVYIGAQVREMMKIEEELLIVETAIADQAKKDSADASAQAKQERDAKKAKREAA